MLTTSFPIPMLNVARQIREFVGLQVNTLPCTQGAQQGQVSLACSPVLRVYDRSDVFWRQGYRWGTDSSGAAVDSTYFNFAGLLLTEL